MCNLHAVSRSPRGGVTSVFLSQSARTRSRCLRLNKRDFRGEREREKEKYVGFGRVREDANTRVTPSILLTPLLFSYAAG